VKTRFPGFPPEGVEFLAKLARNNRREWFQPRKETFETHVKQPMRELVEALNASLKTFAPEFVTEPDKAIYRIYRDTRFSPDKTPYKTHIAASFYRRGGCGHGTGGFYVAVSPKEVAIGGGVYMPEPDLLSAIRGRIVSNHEELRAILRARPVRRLLGDLQGEQLTRVPKGFAPDHPAADLLRYKRFILYVELPPTLASSPELYGEVLQRFRAMQPFLQFLTAARPVSKKKQVTRYLTDL
jgi:uncharacterized protein (TIGR02453 family)